MNLLVVDGFPFATDEVESHPGADNIRTHLIPHDNSILEPETPGALDGLVQQSGVLQQNVALFLQFVFCRSALLTCDTDLFLDVLSLVFIMYPWKQRDKFLWAAKMWLHLKAVISFFNGTSWNSNDTKR